jgi:hypothetical protein
MNIDITRIFIGGPPVGWTSPENGRIKTSLIIVLAHRDRRAIING